jgi:uncharacterized membrane protein
LLLTLLWPAALLAAPYLASRESASAVPLRLAAGIYLLGGRLCHQRAERSFHLWDAQLPVCARCTGIYLGAPLGAAAGMAWSRRRVVRVSRRAWRWALGAAALPIAATLVWEALAQEVVPGTIRALSGAPIGVAVTAFLAVALGGKLKVD